MSDMVVEYIPPIQLVDLGNDEPLQGGKCGECGRGGPENTLWTMRRATVNLMTGDPSFGPPGTPTWFDAQSLIGALRHAEKNDRKDFTITTEIYNRLQKVFAEPNGAGKIATDVYVQILPFIQAYQRARAVDPEKNG